ncbi:MAG: GMC family oxidoreductase [Elusimicrobia bacterium]|nr:GMC family oxidoreductase [Elusimicrobiota bacterium]
MRVDGAAVGGFDEAFDYVVVGSGAAGATAARALASTGRSVCVLEEGPAVDPNAFGDRSWDAFKTMFRDANAQVARGRAFIPGIQGRVLGGSTVINSAIVWRAPDDVLAEWAALGLGDALPARELHRHWDAIEKDLDAAPTPPEVWGGFNRRMHEGALKLGVRAEPTRRFVKDCRATARCLTGCPSGAKRSMLTTYLPQAEAKGALIVTGAEARRIVVKEGRAVAVTGRLAGPGRPAFRAAARRAVVVAASAIQTPQLLARSGVRSPHLGAHFMGHPGTPLTGYFDAPERLWRGATQGYDAVHHRRDGRFKIETIALPPEIVFARLPGAGRRWKEMMALSGQTAIFAVQTRAWAEGTVRERPWGTDIAYDLTRRDMMQIRRGLRFTAELFFAAGAKEVWPGIYGLPERLLPGQEALFEHGPDDPGCYSWILSHLFGTARMATRASAGVVAPDFSVHGVSDLVVADSSLFPTNLGVNPQHTIMAVARHCAERLADRRPR